MLSVSMKILSCQCENEDKKAYGFYISYFYWSFLITLMAVTGLKALP